MQKHVFRLFISLARILKAEKFAKNRPLRHQYAACWVREVSKVRFIFALMHSDYCVFSTDIRGFTPSVYPVLCPYAKR